MGKLASARTPPNMPFVGNGPGDYHDHEHEHDNGLDWRDHTHMHKGNHHQAFTRRQRGTRRDAHYDDHDMRRFVVFYVDDDRPNKKAPVYLIGRRAPRPDMIIETALAMLDQRGIDSRASTIHLFLVDTGPDKGYGQMIDVKMHRIKVTTTPKWELTPFTTL